MRRRWKLAHLGLAFALLLGLACSGEDREATPAVPAGEEGATVGAEGATTGGEGGPGGRATQETWLCPMHPTYIADRKTACPICGMDLIPAAEFQAAEGSSIPGMASVALSDEGIRLAGIRTVPAATGSIESTIRTVGVVVPEESRLRSVQTKVSGWVERVHVAATGQEIARGAPVISIYSPDLLATQQELAQALAARDAASTEEGRRAAEELAGAARQRLRLLDVPESAIEELERTRAPQRTITLRSPAGGVVTARNVVEGQQVAPGMVLLTVADLSRVWIEGSFYEAEASLLASGLSADLSLPYDPTVALSGSIDFIYPYLDPATRTIRVRFVFDNDFGLLKPGMYANVTLRTGAGEGVIIPDHAILETGERSIVFVHAGEGTFTPREVEVGARSEGEALILSGLEPGEEVVVRANFLLDSESRLRAVLSGASGAARPRGGHANEAEPGDAGSGGGAGAVPDPHAGHGGR